MDFNPSVINSIIKYIFDRLLALLLLVMLLPVFIMIALVITVPGWVHPPSRKPGPMFFTQKRVGRHGRLFTIIKFRTMVPHTDVNTVTAANDHRITKAGAFLRKWKLDELPELINVLVGDMSFVGPRPDVPGYADLLTGPEREILSLRPGITGPASLKYYHEEEILAGCENPKEYNDHVIYPDKVKINLKYLGRYNLMEDLKIIFYTLIRKKDYEY